MTTVLSVLVMVGAEAVSDLMGQGHHGVRLAGLHPVVDECHERRVIPEKPKQVITGLLQLYYIIKVEKV